MASAKILDRILKLFRLGSQDANTTEPEMLAAITMARQLMVRHAISQEDVARHQAATAGPDVAPPFVIHEQIAYMRKIRHLAPYDLVVATTVEVLTATRAIYRRTVRGAAHYAGVQFVGTQSDVAVASEVFLIFLEHVRAATRRACGKNKWDVRHTSYALGYATRMLDRARDLSQTDLTFDETQAYALVVQSHQAQLDRYMNERCGPAAKRSTTINPMAYATGYRDGKDASLDTRGVRPGRG